jgi:MoaA/NifB/PqqE/SkfB family radical SAM enzyme
MCRQWREEAKEELSTVRWKAIIDDLHDNGIRNIHFTGGEPLLRSDLPELIAYCAARGITTGMTTNGILLDRAVLTKLADSGLASVVVSIDAVGEAYDKIRGVARVFDKVKRSAGLIAGMKKSRGMDASINFTLMKDTIKEFEPLKSFADELGLSVSICLLDDSPALFKVETNKDEHWIAGEEDMNELKKLLGRLRRYKAGRNGSILINFEGIEYIGRYFNDPLQKKIPCAISQERIILDPYGNLFGGCMSMGTYGNVAEAGVRKLTGDPKYRAAQRNMFYKRCPGCSCGYMFNIRSSPVHALKNIAAAMKYAVTGA